MGDIADGLINGDFDSITGEYLGEGSGFPRTRQGKKTVPYIGENKGSIRGVKNYLKGFEINPSEYYNHCIGYIKESSIKVKGNGWKLISETIQNDWSDFVKYTNKVARKRKGE